MNPALLEADARREVVATAERWRAAGGIDESQLAAIRHRYADDRRRSRSGFRLLFFLFTVAGGLAFWVFLLALFDRPLLRGEDEATHAVLLALLAASAALSAETATRAFRLREHGVEEGLVALALGWGGGAAWLLWYLAPLRDRPLMVAAALSWTLLAGGAAWRWGTPLSGGLAGAALFAALYPLPEARAWWVGAGIALAIASALGSVSPTVAPAHRRRLDELFVVGVAALYAAVHVAGLKSDWLGWATRGTGLTNEVGATAKTLAWLAMTLLPAVLLVVGVWRRDRLPLALGGLLTLATAASAADALDLGPAWLLLGVGGLFLFGLTIGLRWLLAARPDRTIAGFTDEPLYDSAERRSLLEVAASLAAFSPAPRETEAPPGFEPGGGELGGGGASGEF